MDLGVFVRSKTGLQLWLLAPVAVLALAAGGGAIYLRSGEKDILWRQDFLDTAPQLRAVLNNGLAIINNTYAVARNGGEARERLSATLNDTARRSGFTINTLSIDEVAGAQKGLRAIVKGDGLLPGVMKFVDAVERPESLITVESFTLSSARPMANPIYTTDITFRYVYNPK